VADALVASSIYMGLRIAPEHKLALKEIAEQLKLKVCATKAQ
jgi:hypothetical protein